MPKVNGIIETALYVADLEQSEAFYRDLFGLETLIADERMRALNVDGKSVLLLFKVGASNKENPVPGGVIPSHDAQGQIHFAFAISVSELEAWREELHRRSIHVESLVWPERGGTSLYIRDPDGHLVELATPGLWTMY